MSLKIQTPFGHAAPPAPHHAITTHMPTWRTLHDFIDRKPEVMSGLVNMYPRVMLQKDVKDLDTLIIEHLGLLGQNSCLLFPSAKAAAECKDFATSKRRGDVRLSHDDVSIRTFEIDMRLYAVIFPVTTPAVIKLMMSFWTNAGVGVSTRVAEKCLQHANLLRELHHDTPPPLIALEPPVYRQIRERIAGLLERAPVGVPHARKVSPDDVYLYQTGMAAIWYLHQYLIQTRNSTTVLVGFAFQATFHVFEDWGPGFKFFGLATDDELDQLEVFLEGEEREGRPVQAVWTEFPNNPLLVSAELGRLRKLADRYRFILVVDDTIGSFCNVDVLGAADVVITSLTKSFNGYADLMAASTVLNPSSPIYSDLRSMFEESYHNDLFVDDVIALERNSRDYLQRSAALNSNTQLLVDYLQSLVSDSSSSVIAVYHPSVSWSSANYQARMRHTTEDFTPGYGCLFSVEFDTVKSTAAFYDNLNVHCSPHLGAYKTFALPYVKGLYADKLDWAAQWGLRETMIRIAPGLEDSQTLLEDFKIASRAADLQKTKEIKETVVSIA